jgi:hypothetical protein
VSFAKIEAITAKIEAIIAKLALDNVRLTVYNKDKARQLSQAG